MAEMMWHVTAVGSLCSPPRVLLEGHTYILVFFPLGVAHMASRWPQLTRGQFKVWLCRPCGFEFMLLQALSFPVCIFAVEIDYRTQV